MFGTLKPNTCGLGCSGRRAYDVLYCGLCQSLGEHFGTLSRALLSYDAVFLALVADGLMAEAAPPDKCRCPMLPIVHRPTVSPSSPAMRYAAAMQLLLADQWLADRAMDGKRSARAARPLVSPKVAHAREILADLSVPLDELIGFELTQANKERIGVTGPLAAAEPTAEALAVIFAKMPLLPGVAAEAKSDEVGEALGDFGLRLGRVIYLVDALDDLEKDHRQGAFNPCIVKRRDGSLMASWPRIELSWGQIHDDLAALAGHCQSLPLVRHRPLVEGVVRELYRSAKAAAERAHAFARDEEARAKARTGMVRRLSAALVTALMFVWVWLFSRPAHAQSKDAGAAPAPAADAGARPPPGWSPPLPSWPTPAPAGSDKPADPNKGDKSNVPGTKSTSEPGSSTPGTPPSSGACNSVCDKCCNDCCKDCGKECGKAFDCGSCCKGSKCC